MRGVRSRKNRAGVYLQDLHFMQRKRRVNMQGSRERKREKTRNGGFIGGEKNKEGGSRERRKN